MPLYLQNQVSAVILWHTNSRAEPPRWLDWSVLCECSGKLNPWYAAMQEICCTCASTTPYVSGWKIPAHRYRCVPQDLTAFWYESEFRVENQSWLRKVGPVDGKLCIRRNRISHKSLNTHRSNILKDMSLPMSRKWRSCMHLTRELVSVWGTKLRRRS